MTKSLDERMAIVKDFRPAGDAHDKTPEGRLAEK